RANPTLRFGAATQATTTTPAKVISSAMTRSRIVKPINLRSDMGVNSCCRGGFSATADDVAVRIDLLAEDAQFLLARRSGAGQRLGSVQREARRLAHAVQRDAGVQAQHLHAFRLFVVA